MSNVHSPSLFERKNKMDNHENLKPCKPSDLIGQTKKPWNTPRMVSVDIAEETKGMWKVGSDGGGTSTLS